VHTVVVNGRLVKQNHQLVGADLAGAKRAVGRTVEYLIGQMGRDTWNAGMNPDIPASKVLDNPYQYTDYQSESTHGARGTMFGEPGSGS